MPRCLLTLLFLSLFVPLHSQEYFGNLRHIGMDDGLSHYKVLSLYSAEDGMWIGTADGLNYFDGYQWTYRTKENDRLSIKEVDFIQKDQAGKLWLFDTKGVRLKDEVFGIDILEPNAHHSIPFQQYFGTTPPFGIHEIRHFFEDSLGNQYFLTNQQLWQYNSQVGDFLQVSIPEHFKPHIRFEDGTFIGKLNQQLVLVFEDGSLENLAFPLGEEVYRIIGNSQNFGVYQEGNPFCMYQRTADKDYQKVYPPIQPVDGQSFFPVLFDPEKNHFWIYAEPALLLVNLKGETLYKTSVMPRAACLDTKGNLWTGRFEMEVLNVQKNKFKRYLYQTEKTDNHETLYRCRGMVEKNGKLYIGTYLGVQVIDLTDKEKRFKIGKTNDFAFLKDRKQNIWLASRDLKLLDESGTKIEKTFQRSSDIGRIWSLFEDDYGKIWIGEDGLSYLEDGEIKEFGNYGLYPELEEATILFLHKGEGTNIWVGSDQGLYLLAPEKGIIAAYGKNRIGAFFLPSNRFQSMYKDAEGTIWLATEDVGLIRWDQSHRKIETFDKTAGFLSNNIYAIGEDDFGYLWLSSFNGLIQFEKSSRDVAIYNEEDGTSGSEFNRISYYRSDDGRMFFGGQNGITSFKPEDFQIATSKRKPFELTIKHIATVGFRILKDTLPDGSDIDLTKLGADTRGIDLEFRSSNMFWTDKADLHYTLEWINEEGNPTKVSRQNISTDNHIELFGMRPGRYDLKVKAVLKNGKQIGETLIVPIIIARPISHRPIFWVVITLLSMFIIWGFLKIRMAHLQRQKAQLERLVEERTAQILADQKTIEDQAAQIAEMTDRLNEKDEAWLEQFRAIIQERLEDTNLDLPSIIEDMDMGRSVFFEKVKALTNRTPNQYIQDVRLNKAKSLLESGDVKTVKEVSYAVGIKRPSYFSKLFKDRYGRLPSDFLKG